MYLFKGKSFKIKGNLRQYYRLKKKILRHEDSQFRVAANEISKYLEG